ncbi:MAG: choice-of-anchor D domain-containing protein, partial [Flavobacteriales bacterium]|nr:choice-of-anchor D domain-containing protein [Flavobacteriales bacterium]
MKKQLLFLAVLFCSVSLFAQVGNGIELQIQQDYQFSPTTTDSTNSVTIVVYNTVASEQQITFTGLSDPFYTSDSVLTVAANDSSNFVLSFTPNNSGDFSDVLEFSGNIFGSGALNISGEGVQVSISTSTDSLNLGTTAVDEMISSSITIYNNGTGTMEITDITSNNPDFTTSHSSAMISEGGSLELGVEFNTLFSGQSISTISIYSNDPDHPVYDVFVQASAVSELSGSLCGNLQLINSPFTLIGDILVPDTCSLTIEPGVVLNANAFDLIVEGVLDANGTASDSIYLRGFTEIELNNQDQTISFVSIGQPNDFVFFDGFKENNFIDYFNGATDNIEWNSTWGNVDGGIKIYNNQNSNFEVYTDSFLIYSERCVINFDHSTGNNSSGCNPYVKVFYRINAGEWIQLESISPNQSWTNKNYDISDYVNYGDNVQVMFKNEYC